MYTIELVSGIIASTLGAIYSGTVCESVDVVVAAAASEVVLEEEIDDELVDSVALVVVEGREMLKLADSQESV
jgi:hypothetical protein